MPYYCTVPRCTSMAGKAKNVSFHQFPRDEELAKLWNRILKRGKPYTKYSKVCSLHFKPEDYTITSVGKNKGQWRTLRKDAVPSQNLPSESPAPYTRRSTGCWVPAQPSLADPLVQQQMAQAIYMQTMLAMQAAGASESLASKDHQPTELTQPSPSGSSLSEIELLLRKDTDTQKDVTYKCQECTKCFKDPDVFLIHKRTHRSDTTHTEKENYSTNIQDRDETLRSNPILANLLKTSMRLEPENILTVENQIMTALASNMEAYIRTLTSMIASQGNSVSEDRSNIESDFEDNDGNDSCRDGNENEDGNDLCRDEGGNGDGNDLFRDEDGNDLGRDEGGNDDGNDLCRDEARNEDGDELCRNGGGNERANNSECEDRNSLDMCIDTKVNDTPMDEDDKLDDDASRKKETNEDPSNMSTEENDKIDDKCLNDSRNEMYETQNDTVKNYEHTKDDYINIATSRVDNDTHKYLSEDKTNDLNGDKVYEDSNDTHLHENHNNTRDYNIEINARDDAIENDNTTVMDENEMDGNDIEKDELEEQMVS